MGGTNGKIFDMKSSHSGPLAQHDHARAKCFTIWPPSQSIYLSIYLCDLDHNQKQQQTNGNVMARNSTTEPGSKLSVSNNNVNTDTWR